MAERTTEDRRKEAMDKIRELPCLYVHRPKAKRADPVRMPQQVQSFVARSKMPWHFEKAV